MSGYVYFICSQVGDDLMCKIGYTGRHPKDRLGDLQPCSPVSLDIFGYMRGNVQLERKFHRTFDPVRTHGEWFVAENKLRHFVWFLADTTRCQRPLTQKELEVGVYDIILAECSPHPDIADKDFVESADMSEWARVFV